MGGTVGDTANFEFYAKYWFEKIMSIECAKKYEALGKCSFDFQCKLLFFSLKSKFLKDFSFLCTGNHLK